MKIYDVVIDYDLVSSFNVDKLVENLILPIKKEGIYLDCFTCRNSKIDSLIEKNLIRDNYLKDSEILFFLNDIDDRVNLYSLAKNATLDDEFNSSYISEFFLLLVEKVIEARSSDIHIESFENSLVIRFRVDGRLKIFYLFEKSFSEVLSSYIKMLSKLDITNSRTPMDGRFSFSKYDFRVATMPTIYGESIVIRVLDNQNITKDIDALGFSRHILDSIENITKLTQGLVLVSGPTGSGKSTTLYSILKKMNKEDKKIVTIEDPIEYKLEQAQQIEVNEDIGLGFDSILKNILRQDPDIILIGEIRDVTSLKIALQASLTGHLVLASIHANNSIETLSRLIDLKADRYLLSSSLKYILSQRLVLSICQTCGNKGCEKCSFSGFYSRSSISEVLKIDEKISSQILNSEDIKSYLSSIDFKTMLDDGKKKVDEGITTLKEVYKVIEN